SHEARRHGVQLQPWFDHHDGARGVEAQLARYNRDRTGGRPGRHGVSAACGSMAWIWRTVRFQFYDVREFYLGGLAWRVDPIRYRIGYLSCAASASVDGGEDGCDYRSRHQRTVCTQRSLWLVQERVRHVRRADAPAR